MLNWLRITVYVLAMVGHLKNVSPTFAQMPDRITNVEFITVSPTIANTMLVAGVFCCHVVFLSFAPIIRSHKQVPISPILAGKLMYDDIPNLE